MQSGLAGTREWVLDYEPSPTARADPLMGWNGNGDTQLQVKLRFESRDEAVAYADKAGLSYDVEVPHERKVLPKSYSDNFRYGRIENWTH
jgi:hypothetical protein